MKPRFFAQPSAFRAWLEKHHRTTGELRLDALIEASASGRQT